MSWPILSVLIKYEQDIVVARQRAKQIAALLGFDVPDQTRIATAVSEIARNAYSYAGGGKATFHLEGKTAPQVLLIMIKDLGPGIANLPAVLQTACQSSTGLGLGIVGVRRLMDQFEINSASGSGTTVWLKKLLPKKAPLITVEKLQQIVAQLTQHPPQSPLEEVQQQNQELLSTLDELHQRQEELSRLNQELEDTNRGVVALYAELDEKADHLRRADEMKSRFLSNMSHEFRTPLNSILALARLLLDRTDGELTSEQEKQVRYIRQAGQELLELVNDLLDLAKIEAGKVEVQPADFTVTDLFSALRGMLKPLLLNETLTLIFEAPENIPSLYTDEGKVSQILRNFLSNALKFTEYGEVRVSATFAPERNRVVFAVADTGIGIAPENQTHIFEEFTQLEHPLQRQVKGTGLGLPLCRKLATLLGGNVGVESELGTGSTFFAEIPVNYAEIIEETESVPEALPLDNKQLPVLLVEDEAGTRLLYEKFLRGTGFQAVPARTIREAQQLLERVQPKAIILDILLPDQEAWTWLAQLKSNEYTRHIPVLIITVVEDSQKGLALGADAYHLKPVERSWLLEQLTRLTSQRPIPNLLLVDDEETGRYLLKKMLSKALLPIHEAANGPEGLRLACEKQPHAIFLDLIMPDISGFEFIAQLKANPTTHSIPVIVVTSKILSAKEKQQLLEDVQAILPKDTLSEELVLHTLKKVMQVTL